MGTEFLVLEPRLRAAVFYMAGFQGRNLPEVDPATFLPRVKVPVVMLSGALDAGAFQLEESAKPFFRLIGTAEAEKKHVIAESGHFVARRVYIRETLDWYDRCLRPVAR